MSAFVKIYVSLVREGKYTIDQVPEGIREQVRAIINQG